MGDATRDPINQVIVTSIYIDLESVEVFEGETRQGVTFILSDGSRVEFMLDLEDDTVKVSRDVPVVINEEGAPRHATRAEVADGYFHALAPTSEVKVHLPIGRLPIVDESR